MKDAKKVLEQATETLATLEEEVETGTLGPEMLEAWKAQEREWLDQALKQVHGRGKAVLRNILANPYEAKHDVRKYTPSA